MHPTRFGANGQPLFGAFHKPGVRAASAHAVLLCNPFGQEAVRIHRFFKVLADRLSREGIACLRFDYFGTGDSLGEDEDVDLDRWAQDILSADELLRQRAMCQKTTWIAPRLAAPLAARASRMSKSPPEQIVFWDPVVNGLHYLNSLDESHRTMLDSLPAAHQHQEGAELFGFACPPLLRDQITDIDAPSFAGVQTRHAPVLSQHGLPGDAALLSAQLVDQGVRSTEHTLPIQFDWTSEEALNTALVPAEALHMLTQLVKGFQDE